MWLQCSGAYNRMITNPGYYEALKNTTLRYPHSGPQEMEKDLRRSGAGLSDADVDSMRYVLTAFIMRNPTVGYC